MTLQFSNNANSTSVYVYVAEKLRYLPWLFFLVYVQLIDKVLYLTVPSFVSEQKY